MPKRKREDKDEGRPRPFLSLPETSATKDELLPQVLEFSKNSKDTNEKALLFLLDVLDKAEQTSRSAISLEDVALLVLPWSIKNILGSAQEHELVWRALHASLQCLVAGTAKDNLSVQYTLQQQILTQSTLFKLCPKVALIRSRHAALAYAILTEAFFRPTLDVACKSLLLPVTNQSKNSSSSDTDAAGVVQSTLKLLRKLQLSRKGNPKTTFQLMASRPILLALSQQHQAGHKELVKEILSDALFQSHLEGYYSILHKASASAAAAGSSARDHKGKFRCYQEELLATLDALLDPNNKNEADLLHTLHLLPVLYECFLEQKWDKKNVFLIQFQLFARWTALLQEQQQQQRQQQQQQEQQLLAQNQSSSKLQSSAVHSMQTLGQLLHLVLQHNVYTPSQDGSDGQHFDFLKGIAKQVLPLPSTNSIPVLTTLLRLNHLLVHEDAPEILQLCVSQQPAGGMEYWTCFWNVYRQLRQQNFAVQAVLQVISDDSAKGMMTMMMERREPSAALAHAIHTCPIGQTRDIFGTLEDWIQTKRTVSVALVSLITRNVRVDKSTAPEVASLCRGFVERAIPDSSGEALSFCACMLDLHSHCAFWLGRHVMLDVPSRLLTLLEDAMSGKSLSIGHEEGLVFLGCQRLRQLHSDILEHERRDLEEQNIREKSVSASRDEAERLASFLAFTATKSPDRLWRIIAQNFAYWVQFASEEHTQSFLKWVCKTIVISEEHDEAQTHGEDCEVTMVLLEDASFYENPKVSSAFAIAALSSSIDILITALETLPSSDHHDAAPLLARLKGSGESMVDSLKLLTRSTVVLDDLSSKAKGTLLREAEAASRLIIRMTSMPLPINNAASIVQSTNVVGKLEFAFRCLHGMCDDAKSVSLKVVSTLRLYLSTVLEDSGADFTWDDDDARLVAGLFEASSGVLDAHESFEQVDAFFCATGKLIRCVVGTMLVSVSNTAVSKAIQGALTTSEHQSQYAFLRLGRDILERIDNQTSNMEQDEGFQPVKEALWRLVTSHLQSEKKEMQLEAMLLACDMIRSDPSINLNVVEAVADFGIQTLNSQESDTKVVDACCVMVGCFAMTNPPKLLRDRILQLVAFQRKQPELVLDAAFCKLVQTLSTYELDALLNDLLQVDESGKPSKAASPPLRLALLLFQYLREDSQVEVMEKFGSNIYSLVLSQLAEPELSDEKSLNVTLTVLDNLVRRRDVFIFREFDLAVTLSQLSTLLGTLEQGATTTTTRATIVAPSSYSLCTTVLASMFHRYSKLLYACVPSVITLYHVLQSHAMNAADTLERSQGFCGVCELLIAHKEIYKKHVLGLLLEFVHGLGDMSLERRESLIPAIYSLLDVMSTYEMQQLNATMASHHKILFRTVMQGYRKVHVYKGQ